MNRVSAKRQPMDSPAVRVRLRDAQVRLESAQLQLGGSSPHEWKHAAEIAVSAGIAASDAICGHVLGYRVSGDAHAESVAALKAATDAATAKRLDSLLAVKSVQSYGDRLPTRTDAERYVREAERMLAVAERVVATR